MKHNHVNEEEIPYRCQSIDIALHVNISQFTISQHYLSCPSSLDSCKTVPYTALVLLHMDERPSDGFNGSIRKCPTHEILKFD